MRTMLALGLLFAAALLPLACGKSLPTGETLTVQFPTTTFTPTLTFTATPNGPTATATPAGWEIFTNTSISTGQYSYGYVHIHNGASLTISGAVTLNLDSYFALDSGSTVIGDGNGYGQSDGPGSPQSYSLQGAGAGHGGAGGNGDGTSGSGNSTVDSTTNPSQMGSGGGEGTDFGGAGGGLFRVVVANGPASLYGTISMNGAMGFTTIASTVGIIGGGGGAGGTIYIQAPNILGSAFLSALGAAGGNTTSGAGGGGGGGIVVLCDHLSNNFSGTVTLTGGAGGVDSSNASLDGTSGGTGVFNTTTY